MPEKTVHRGYSPVEFDTSCPPNREAPVTAAPRGAKLYRALFCERIPEIRNRSLDWLLRVYRNNSLLSTVTRSKRPYFIKISKSSPLFHSYGSTALRGAEKSHDSALCMKGSAFFQKKNRPSPYASKSASLHTLDKSAPPSAFGGRRGGSLSRERFVALNKRNSPALCRLWRQRAGLQFADRLIP